MNTEEIMKLADAYANAAQGYNMATLNKARAALEAAIAQYRESLLAGVGEAVAWRVRWPAMGGGYKWVMNDKPVMQADGFVNERLFNADQMAAAVAIERERCAQIAWNYEPDENGPIEAAIRGQR